MPKAPNLTSYTELSTLSHCEMKWWLRYKEGIKGEQSNAMLLGTIMGKCCDAFWRGDDWSETYFALVDEKMQANLEAGLPLFDYAFTEPWVTAKWLMERYVEQYGSSRCEIEVVAQEAHYKARIPHTRQIHEAYVDEVWRDSLGRHWMVERKTYGRANRTDLIEVDPQLTLNLWVAREASGIDFAGIVWDGIYTYRWKPEKPTQKALIAERIARASNSGDDEFACATKAAQTEWAREAVERHPGVETHPPSDSFEQLWLDRTEDHIDAALDDVRAAVRRREALRRGAKPLRNLGPFCSGCAGKPECWGRLAFPVLGDIEIED